MLETTFLLTIDNVAYDDFLIIFVINMLQSACWSVTIAHICAGHVYFDIIRQFYHFDCSVLMLVLIFCTKICYTTCICTNLSTFLFANHSWHPPCWKNPWLLPWKWWPLEVFPEPLTFFEPWTCIFFRSDFIFFIVSSLKRNSLSSVLASLIPAKELKTLPRLEHTLYFRFLTLSVKW